MVTDVQIRVATLADVTALQALVQRAYRGDSARGGWTHEADLLDDERTSDAELSGAIADPATCVLVAESADRLIGTVTVRAVGTARSYLGMLCVDPFLQAGGLGRRLLAAAEAVARDRFGAGVMEMTVIDRRPELIAWYERCGYTRSGETRQFPGSPEVPFAMVVLVRDLVV